MSIRLRLLVPVLLALGLTTTSCVDDLGQGPKGGPVGLALKATVTGLSAAVTYTVSVQVSYQIAGGGSRSLEARPSSFQITGGAPAASDTITVVLAPCLDDPDRVDAEAEGCRLSVTLGLSDGVVELAQASEDLGLVTEGQLIERPIAITPNYNLTIGGGGPGTGSGTVTISPVGGPPQVTCQIVDGQASATGCTARYPLHTAVVLTASGGSLASWSGDCDGIAADNPCQLAMDGHRNVGASFVAAPTTGELEVEISGLPAGTPAQVTVANTSGFSQQVTETTVLSGLLPGVYTVTANPVLVSGEGRTYSPAVPSQSVSVAVGERATVQIGYSPPETGRLVVTIAGLPVGTAAAVTVTGPSNFSQPLAASQTLSGLPPGAYRIAAENVETSDQIYVPAPPTQPITVSPNVDVEATVTYAATRASLTVNISGLPSGLDANVTVTGPSGFRQELTATTAPPLVKLTPGNYTVRASSVTSQTEQVFDPAVSPQQPVLIRAGQSATVSVTYAVPAATKLVFVQQPTTTVIGEVITPPVTVEARDAQDRPVPGYAAEVTLTLQDDSEQDPSGATLGGTTRVIPQNGIASFGDLTVDRARSRFTLLAASGTLAPATSDRFTVTSGVPSITSVEFPETVSNGPNTVVQANVGFSDPGRDITELLVAEVSDPNNVYSPQSFSVSAPSEGPDVFAIALWQCSAPRGCPTGSVTLDLTLRDLDGNTSTPARVSFSVSGSTPAITAIDFPKVIPAAANTFTLGTIDFSDADGDVVLVDAEVIQCVGTTTCGWTDFDPHVSGQTQGSLSFSYGCSSGSPCYGIKVTLRFVLEDFAGNRSASVDLSFQFEDQIITSLPSGSISRGRGTEGKPGQKPER